MAKTFRDYFKSPRNVAIFVILGLVFFGGLIFLLSGTRENEGLISEDQIRIQRGDKIVTINRNGLVEYRTSEGVFYQTWDSSQVANFFALMEARAREYLANPNPSACDTGYSVTLYLDGKEVTVCFAEDDEILGEVFQEFSDDGGDGDLSDVFDDYFGDDESGGTATPTLSPTPVEVSAGEGEDVPGGSGGGGSLPVVSCELNEEDVTSRTVISNILCAPDEPSPTPTPTPTP